MAILVKSGRVVMAQSIALQQIHLAWGEGDGAWNTPPAEDVNATGLIAEIGRRTATQVGFVIPDNTGDIVLTSGSFRLSDQPTNSLYIRTQFDYTDAPGSSVREIGLFVGTVTAVGLPAGQQYFTPSQIVDRGRMLHLEHFSPIFRGTDERTSFEVVVTF